MFDALASLLVYEILGFAATSRLGSAVHFFVMDLAKIFVLLVLVIYAMGLLRAMLAPERVRDFVRGRPDWQARGFAVTLGAVQRGAWNNSQSRDNSRSPAASLCRNTYAIPDAELPTAYFCFLRISTGPGVPIQWS